MKKYQLLANFVFGLFLLAYLAFVLFFIFVLDGEAWSLAIGLFLGELYSIKERVKSNTATVNILHIVSTVLLIIASFEPFGQASLTIFFITLFIYLFSVGFSFKQTYGTKYDEEGAKKI